MRPPLAWGYVDQPPFVPLVARAADLLAPGNLVVLRLLPALAAAVTIAAGSVIAGELGGGRAGRIAGAGVVAAGGFVLGVGHLLSTAVFDLTAWMVLLAIGCRMLRTSDPRWWVPFGGGAGLALLNKNLVVLLCASLAVGLVVERRWRLLATAGRSPRSTTPRASTTRWRARRSRCATGFAGHGPRRGGRCASSPDQPAKRGPP